jgi:hypothetical protein
MKAAKPLTLIFACLAVYFFKISFLLAQTMQGVYSGNFAGELSVITLEQKGEMIYGQLYDKQMNKREFFGAKEKSGFRGVMEISGEEKEVSAKIEKSTLLLTVKSGGEVFRMDLVSKNLAYDFSKLFPDQFDEIRDKLTGVWILKEQYKIDENGEKVQGEMTGKDYMFAYMPDGKYVADIRGFRDAQREIPAEYRMSGSEMFEAANMMSWRILNDKINIYPTKAIPGSPVNDGFSRYFEFKGDQLILRGDMPNGWTEHYVKKD